LWSAAADVAEFELLPLLIRGGGGGGGSQQGGFGRVHGNLGEQKLHDLRRHGALIGGGRRCMGRSIGHAIGMRSQWSLRTTTSTATAATTTTTPAFGGDSGGVVVVGRIRLLFGLHPLLVTTATAVFVQDFVSLSVGDGGSSKRDLNRDVAQRNHKVNLSTNEYELQPAA
jgi:hypothetical protein